MNRNIFALFIVSCALIACRSEPNVPADVEYVEYASMEYENCENCMPGQAIKYSMPNGNDLVLETPKRIIQIEAQPGKSYDYYVWTGDKSYDDDPDLIVQDGVAAVLVEE